MSEIPVTNISIVIGIKKKKPLTGNKIEFVEFNIDPV